MNWPSFKLLSGVKVSPLELPNSKKSSLATLNQLPDWGVSEAPYAAKKYFTPVELPLGCVSNMSSFHHLRFRSLGFWHAFPSAKIKMTPNQWFIDCPMLHKIPSAGEWLVQFKICWVHISHSIIQIAPRTICPLRKPLIPGNGNLHGCFIQRNAGLHTYQAFYPKAGFLVKNNHSSLCKLEFSWGIAGSEVWYSMAPTKSNMLSFISFIANHPCRLWWRWKDFPLCQVGRCSQRPLRIWSSMNVCQRFGISMRKRRTLEIGLRVRKGTSI